MRVTQGEGGVEDLCIAYTREAESRKGAKLLLVVEEVESAQVVFRAETLLFNRDEDHFVAVEEKLDGVEDAAAFKGGMAKCFAEQRHRCDQARISAFPFLSLSK